MSENTEFDEYDVNGLYRPCAACAHPAAVIVAGVTLMPPGGATLQWELLDGGGRQLWITPHTLGCPETETPSAPEEGRMYLPPSVVTNTSVDFPRPRGDQ